MRLFGGGHVAAVDDWHDIEPASLAVIDLPALSPEHDRARLVGSVLGHWLGIAAVYLVAGAILSYRGAAWCVRRARR